MLNRGLFRVLLSRVRVLRPTIMTAMTNNLFTSLIDLFVQSKACNSLRRKILYRFVINTNTAF